MKIINFTVIIISLLIINVSIADEIINKTKSEPIKIVVLGSSTAFGTGPSHPDSAWVNRYRKYVQNVWPGSEVINLAKGGYKTYHVLPDDFVPSPERPSPDTLRNITKALSYHPTAIIINLPSNDATAGYSVQEQLANYDIIISLTSESGVPVWVATTQPRNLSAAGRQNLIDMRDSTYTRFENPIDFWTGLAEADGNIKPKYNSGDNVHLNDAAHKILFERAILVGAGLPSTNLK
jgi:lysophospholipase L1-like esterase